MPAAIVGCREAQMPLRLMSRPRVACLLYLSFFCFFRKSYSFAASRGPCRIMVPFDIARCRSTLIPFSYRSLCSSAYNHVPVFRATCNIFMHTKSILGNSFFTLKIFPFFKNQCELFLSTLWIFRNLGHHQLYFSGTRSQVPIGSRPCRLAVHQISSIYLCFFPFIH